MPNFFNIKKLEPKFLADLYRSGPQLYLIVAQELSYNNHTEAHLSVIVLSLGCPTTIHGLQAYTEQAATALWVSLGQHTR